ncbi:MAG: carbamoyltransferase HypF [Chloroflexi bacterium RBG_16_47_49]|nr:MAG: carbamoyltransferase HypF [Chloroflexi bacterium RBG_16_47_49]
MIATRIHITGIIQGVGFRPFVYNQALRHGLTGWVCNTSAGVDIEVNGEPGEISTFIQELRHDAPPIARIDSFEYHQTPTKSFDTFEIIQSKEVSNAFQPISPDICICQDCLNELLDPENRRYRYPFINCTNCGPRLTIIDEIPYDRPNTTMKDFDMCPDCVSEYTDPTNRRFHAQPIACPVCGPQVWLEIQGKKIGAENQPIAIGDEAILAVQKLLSKGKIVAIKGLGGFHLACDATNPKAVAELRNRKLRIDKPFALMMPDIATIESHCQINEIERELLESRERPIVILARRDASTIDKDVSPRQNTLGVLLPYTPLHHLLFASPDNKKGIIKKIRAWRVPPLVMTSANLSEEPIAINNEEARQRLSGLADAFLFHDRLIRTRCDDSVLRVFRGASFPIRRSRGYAPFPVYLASESPKILATGAELKNTFCIVRDRYAFLSHHIGNMENVETYDSFVDSIAHYESLFRVKPDAIAYDLHPNYLATRYAIDRAGTENLPSYGIQHHHAHVASCMAENSLGADQSVIGVAFDGTGYGEDGAIWGGEFLLANYLGFKRVGHLKYIPLPGGDASIHKPARIALAYLWASQLDWEPEYQSVAALCAEERSIIKSQLELKINSPQSSSMGRFFDAIASITGVRQKVNYEAQAAIEFEAIADPHEYGEYNFQLEPDANPDYVSYQINPTPLLEEVLENVHHGIAVSTISARFHNSIARVVCKVCCTLRSDYGVNHVCLSGGVWQNMRLLAHTCELLNSEAFNVYIHHQVPTNDGGLALGQAIVAIHRMSGR